MRYYLTLIILGFYFSLSCQNRNIESKNGYNIFYYPNDQISSEGVMKEGKPDGLWKTYYVDGVIKSIGIRKNGFLDSVWVFYNEEGLIREKINYLNGKKNGYYYSFNFLKNNDSITVSYLEKEDLYSNNTRNGISNYYFPNGVIQFSVNYIDGKRQGYSKEYDKLGNLITVIQYQNGREIDRSRINRMQDSVKYGVWKDFYPNGKIKSEMNYAFGNLHGLYKEYNLIGELVLTHRYANGKLVDTIVEIENDIDIIEEFYDLRDSIGELIPKSSGGFIDGKPVGVHRSYDSLGRVNSSRLFDSYGNLIGKGIVNIEGDRVGNWFFYYSDGMKRSEGQYERNRRVGLWIYYYSFGGIEQRGDFKRGRPNGKWVWYYDTGSIKREEFYKNGKEDGESTEFDKAGNIITQGSYLDGFKDGEWFFNYGFHTEKGKFENDVRTGEWTFYFNNGNVYFIGSFFEGKEDGKHLYYYRNGQLKEKRYYVFGRKNKNWEFYDFYGSLLKIRTFENNKLTKIDGISVQIDEN